MIILNIVQQKCTKLCDNNLTKEELLPYIKVTKASFKDAPQIINILMKSGFNIHSEREVLNQLLESNADLNNSVKLIDERTNDIYGLLIFSKYSINEGSPLPLISPILASILRDYTQLNGFAFVIDERLRGTNFDKQMLEYNYDFINEYDFIWCGVETELKSHNYWKRLGFYEIASIPQAKFYIRLQNKRHFADIYNKCKSAKYEKDYN